MAHEENTSTETTTDDHAPPRKSSPKALIWLLLFLAGVGVFAFIPWLSGTGWFGYRDWMYEGGELYVLNMNDYPVVASVDGFNEIEIPAQNAQRLDLVGGTSELVITKTETGEELERRGVTLDGAHALFKVQPAEECLAVVDVSSYYSGQKGARPVIVDKIMREDTLHVLDTRNVIWPRKAFPSKVDPSLGEMRWLSIVGCELFEDEEYLIGYLGYRIEEGFKKAQEKKNGGQPVRQTL